MEKGKEIKRRWFSFKLLTGILLFVFFAISLSLRTIFPYNGILGGNWIKFGEVDAYYQMHLVDIYVRNFPHLSTFDPYFTFPGGSPLGLVHAFNWLLALFIWIIGLGSPSEHLVNVIGAYFPAVLGALTIIPVYFIGKELFGRWAGVASAGLIAITPGEFLGRSILGFTDYHVAEVLLTATSLAFLIVAIKTARERNLSFRHIKEKKWSLFTRPFIYSVLGGFFLGLYLITWGGALLFVLITSIFFIIQSIIDHLKGKSTDYLSIAGLPFFVVSTLIFYVVVHSAPSYNLYIFGMILALLTPLVLNGISRLISGKKPVYYPIILVVGGVGLLLIAKVIAPAFLDTILKQFNVFFPTGAQLTTLEMQPFFKMNGAFSLTLPWANFTTDFFLAIISLGIIIYLIIKQGSPEKTLLITWSLIILILTWAQRRFAYYLAVNVALLAGYLCWQALRVAGLKEPVLQEVEPVKPVKAAKGKKATPKRGSSPTSIKFANIAFTGLIVFLVAFFPNIPQAIPTASQTPFAPSDAWCEALTWIKTNTPEPFGDPNFYYHLETSNKYLSLSQLKALYPNSTNDSSFYSKLPRSYPYPQSAYGVLSWWDYGYWIMRIAHRIPNANPGQDPDSIKGVASFFLTQDEDSASKAAKQLGSAYIVIDSDSAYSKFWAMALWNGQNQGDYFDVYYVQQDNTLQPAQLFYPAYYQSMVSRLYNFDGKAVEGQNPVVISYEDRVDNNGTSYKLIMSGEQFATYEEADTYLKSQTSANYRLVGTNPTISPVPLTGLTQFQLVHSSNSTPGLENVAPVKVFQFTS